MRETVRAAIYRMLSKSKDLYCYDCHIGKADESKCKTCEVQQDMEIIEKWAFPEE